MGPKGLWASPAPDLSFSVICHCLRVVPSSSTSMSRVAK